MHHMRVGCASLPQPNSLIQKVCPSSARGDATAQEAPQGLRTRVGLQGMGVHFERTSSLQASQHDIECFMKASMCFCRVLTVLPVVVAGEA